MAQVRLLWEQVEELNQALAEAMKEHVAVLHRLTQMPGVDLYAAQELLAEIGPGAVVFPSAEQFVSWIGVCPGSQESAGVNYSHRSAIRESLSAAFTMPDCLGRHPYQRDLLRQSVRSFETEGRRQGAAWAVAHRIAKIIWMILHNGVEYQEKGPAPLNQRTLLRKLRRVMREFGRQSIDVKSLLEQELTATS